MTMLGLSSPKHPTVPLLICASQSLNEKNLLNNRVEKIFHAISSSVAQSTMREIDISQTALLNNLVRYHLLRREDDKEILDDQGICNGLTLLYGYYQFLEQEEEFYRRIAAVNTNEFTKENQKDLKTKTYREISKSKTLKELEDLTNDVLYLQNQFDTEELGQSYYVEMLKKVSKNSVIQSLDSRFNYVSFFQFGPNKKCPSLLYVIKALCQTDKEVPKLLLLSANNHLTGIFYREGIYCYYDANNSTIFDSFRETNIDDMETLIANIEESFNFTQSQRFSFALSLNLISSKKLPGLKEISNHLSEMVCLGTDSSETLKLAVQDDPSARALGFLVKKVDRTSLQNIKIKNKNILEYAADWVNTESITLLVNKGVKPTEKCFQKAIDNDALIILQALLSATKESDLQKWKINKDNLLECALNWNSPKSITFFLNKGMKPTEKCFYYAVFSDQPEYLQLLLNKAPLFGSKEWKIEENTLLESAILHKKTKCVTFLLNIGMKPTKKSFQYAIYRDQPEFLQALFDKSSPSDPLQYTIDGINLLEYAISFNRTKSITFLQSLTDASLK